jgi:hypothetical protein
MLSKSQDRLYWKDEMQKAGDSYKRELYERKVKKEVDKQTFIRDNDRIIEMKKQRSYVRVIVI